MQQYLIIPLIALLLPSILAAPADLSTDISRCLKSAGQMFPRDADPAHLTESERFIVHYALKRSACPVDAGSRTFPTPRCKTCNITSIDLNTQAGRDTILSMITNCVLQVDSSCCACVLKYTVNNYFNAVVNLIPTLPGSGTTTPTTTTTGSSGRR